MKNKHFVKIAWVLLAIPMSFIASAEEAALPEKLKVCADPYMLPFSNQERAGYENKIAELFAKKLGVDLEYTWFPQRMGFIRNTLKSEVGTSGEYKCDLVMNVPSNFELAATTDPYYTTSYALVYAKGRGLDDISDPFMLNEEFVEKNKPDLKFGLADKGPAQLWVFYQGLMSNMVPFQGQPGDPTVHPGQVLMEKVANGELDATIVWGPTAGYYAKKYKDKSDLVLLPLTVNSKQNAEARYVYSMSMAVRYGEKAWKEQVNKLLKENKEEINKILADYGVPLIEN